MAGQETAGPSEEYLTAAKAAIEAVALSDPFSPLSIAAAVNGCGLLLPNGELAPPLFSLNATNKEPDET